MQVKSKWSRWLAMASLLMVGAAATYETSQESDSQLVANKWKVRPAPGRNYRRFYRDWQPGYGYGMGMPGIPVEEVPAAGDLPASGDLPTGSRHNQTNAVRRAG